MRYCHVVQKIGIVILMSKDSVIWTNWYIPGGVATAGDSHCSWSVADAAELPPVGALAEGAGEAAGEVGQAPSRLPPLAHHRTHPQFPHWHPATFTEGWCDGWKRVSYDDCVLAFRIF